MCAEFSRHRTGGRGSEGAKASHGEGLYGFRVWGLGFEFRGSGFSVQLSGFKVLVSGFRV